MPNQTNICFLLTRFLVIKLITPLNVNTRILFVCLYLFLEIIMFLNGLFTLIICINLVSVISLCSLVIVTFGKIVFSKSAVIFKGFNIIMHVNYNV